MHNDQRMEYLRRRGLLGCHHPNNVAFLIIIAVFRNERSQQKRIVAEVERRLSAVEELEAVVSANLQRASRLQSVNSPKGAFGPTNMIPNFILYPSAFSLEKAVVSANLQRAARLRQSILQKASTGGLV